MPKTIKITLLIIQWAIDRKPADECYALIENCDDGVMFNVTFERVNVHITSIRSSTATFTDSPNSKLIEILVNKGAMINQEKDV